VLQIVSKALQRQKTQRAQSRPMVIAVSGPYGSTGKTTVAINLSLELASERSKVLLIDGDLRGSSIANHFSLSDLPAGLPGAIRIANQKRFDMDQLARLSVPMSRSSLVVMPGFSSPPAAEVPTEALAEILDIARQNFDFTVIDLGPVVSEAWASDSFTEAVFASADRQLFVCLADPIGIFRLLAGEQKLLEVSTNALVVMNRVRNSVIASARREIAITLQRLSQLEIACYLPDDPQQIDQAVRTGIPAASLSRGGAFRQAMTGFVRAEILGNNGQLDSRVTKLG
jgi:MinD-like ATPase involved in chromosome partitioning or flagellar assembly